LRARRRSYCRCLQSERLSKSSFLQTSCDGSGELNHPIAFLCCAKQESHPQPQQTTIEYN
jgi:hypothetical protein